METIERVGSVLGEETAGGWEARKEEQGSRSRWHSLAATRPAAQQSTARGIWGPTLRTAREEGGEGERETEESEKGSRAGGGLRFGRGPICA